MRQKLTSRTVKAAATTERRYLVHDTQISGFRLVVSPSGRKSYFLRYRVGGGRTATIREPKIGDYPALAPEQARQIALDWMSKIRLGGDPGGARTKRREAPDISQLFSRYLSEHARIHKKPSSVRNDEALIRNVIVPKLGKTKVSDISREDVSTLHQSMRRTPYQANRALSLISKAMNLAEIWGLRPDGSNPTLHVRKYAEQKRKRYLSQAETKRLANILADAERTGRLPSPTASSSDRHVPISAQVVAAIRLLLFTGARSREILTLRWEWVDLERRVLTLPDTKTGFRSIHLNHAAMQVLRGITPVSGNEYVIVGAKPGAHLVNIKDPWRVIRECARLNDFRLHDLRHSFASFAVASGLSLPMIGALLGHSQPATTARYAHLADDPLKAAVGVIGEAIDGSIGSTVNWTDEAES